LTDQEFFDITARHLLTQRTRSTKYATTTESSLCAYRGMGGCKCALGVHIPDKDYDPRMECTLAMLFSWAAFGSDDDYEPELGRRFCDRLEIPYIGEMVQDEYGNVPEKNTRYWLAAVLQGVHDDNKPDEWAEALREVAAEQSLSAAVVDETEALHVSA
jgi:hypothetical protein